MKGPAAPFGDCQDASKEGFDSMRDDFLEEIDRGDLFWKRGGEHFLRRLEVVVWGGDQ